MPETPTLAIAGRAYSGLRPVLNRLVCKDESWSLGTSGLQVLCIFHKNRVLTWFGSIHRHLIAIYFLELS